MKASEVVHCYFSAQAAAQRIGQRFILDDARLMAWGFSRKQIQAVRGAIKKRERFMERFDAALDRLDERLGAKP